MDKEIEEYILNLKKKGMKLGLDNMKSLLNLLDHPDRNYKIIHVGGTNGKGSTCQYIYNILRESGLSVGIFTSPITGKINNTKILVDDELKEEKLDEISKKLISIIEENELDISEFEFFTGLSLEYFKEMKVDFAIVEVGLGGRLDATNAIDKSFLSIFTSIDMDHKNILGDSLEEIANEKKKIIKENSNVVINGNDKINYLLVEEAKKNNSNYTLVDRSKLSLIDLNLKKMVFSYKDFKEIESRNLGFAQMENIITAIEAINYVKKYFNISDENIYEGIKKTRLKYRFEIVKDMPLTIIDGAHNPEAVKNMIENIVLTVDRSKVRFVFGSLRDKDYRQMVDSSYLRAKKYYLIKPINKRGLDTRILKEIIDEKNVDNEEFESIEDAIKKAFSESSRFDVIVVFGSFYNTSYAEKIIKEL